MDPTQLDLEWLNKAIDYTQTIIARLSGLLLMLGLVAAMANLLTDGNVLDHSVFLQQAWAWTQAIAVDANLWLMCVRSVQSIQAKDRFKSCVYISASSLLFFVAVDVTALESLKQALNVTLPIASTYTYIPIFALTIVRSFVVVALVFISGLEVMSQRNVQRVQAVQKAIEAKPVKRSPFGTITNIEELEQRTQELLRDTPDLPSRKLAALLGVSNGTANKLMKKARALAPIVTNKGA